MNRLLHPYKTLSHMRQSSVVIGSRLLARVLPALILLALVGCAAPRGSARPTGPWNVAGLRQTPAHTWGARTGLVQEVYYTGEPFRGRPTRVFAYLGRPNQGKGPFPALLLVHGGGGKAFRDWAEHWAQRRYVALALDTAGNGPSGPLPDGGPDQSDQAKFRDFTEAEVREMWTYHAVAAIIRGHGLLTSLPEVDRRRIGITGISWGGYLTCLAAGLDDDLRVAVPVYGCGFLHHDSVWKESSLARMTAEARARWVRHFDPSQYLANADCPILFLNGSNDFAYPLDSYQESYQLVSPRLRWVSIVLNLPHGHLWTFREVDAFIDRVLRGAQPLPRLGSLEVRGDTVSVSVKSATALRQAELNYTSDTGAWQKRKWQTAPAEVRPGKIVAPLPRDRPLTFFLSVTDERGLRMSAEHQVLPGATAPR